jgi:hypothetical protein
MRTTAIAALVFGSALLAGCQTTSGPSAGALARLQSAGFVDVPGLNSLKIGEVSVQAMLMCKAASCSPPSLVISLSGPDQSTGLGSTLEEAIRAGRNRQVTEAIRKQLKSDRNFTLQSVQPYVQSNEARVRIAGRFVGSAAIGTVLIGDALVQGNLVTITAAVGKNQAITSRFLNIALDR